jgi:AcrR family transcriptional regulator
VTAGDQRKLRGARTRERLTAAALELFDTVGYGATTVDQIADRAGVSPRTFFHHYPSKEDILFDGYADRLREAARRFRSRSPTSLWAALSAVSDAVVDAIEEQPATFRRRALLYDEEPALRATMLRVNEDWIDEMTLEVAAHLGLDPRVDVRPRLAAALVNSANRTAIDHWVAAGGAVDLRTLARDALALVRPSITRIERSAVAPLPGVASAS